MGNELRTALIGYAPEYGEKNNNDLTYAMAGYGSKYASDEDKRSDSAAYAGMGVKYLANGGYLDPTKRNVVGERGPEEIVGTPQGFYVLPRKQRRTDAFLPMSQNNFTPANQMPAMPDFSGGNQNDGQSTMPSALSSLVGLQAKPQGNTQSILPQGYDQGMPNGDLIDPRNQTQQRGGLYDDWKKPVFGNMPLDKFVQLTGMMANAIAPNEWSGRLGRDMANMAGQASNDRRDYEEREQQRADLNKKYEDAQKEKRMDKAIEFAMKTDNPALAKAAYGVQKKQWEEDFGVALPDWNPEQTPDIMEQIQKYRDGAKELGLSAEEQRQGIAEILFGAGEITGKELLETMTPKEGSGVKEYTIGDKTVYLTPEEATARRAELGGPRYKPPSTNVSVTNNVGSKSMTKLGETMAVDLVEERKNALGAASSLANVKEAEKLLSAGMITGTGAEYLTNLGNFLSSRLGVQYAKDPVANTQAYAATMGNQVGQIIKQFGSGTGLSDADREYAEKIVGGKITLNEGAIRKLLAINKKAYTNVLRGYNKRAKEAMSKPGADELPYDLIVPYEENTKTSSGWVYQNGKLIKQ